MLHIIWYVYLCYILCVTNNMIRIFKLHIISYNISYNLYGTYIFVTYYMVRIFMLHIICYTLYHILYDILYHNLYGTTDQILYL